MSRKHKSSETNNLLLCFGRKESEVKQSPKKEMTAYMKAFKSILDEANMTYESGKLKGSDYILLGYDFSDGPSFDILVSFIQSEYTVAIYVNDFIVASSLDDHSSLMWYINEVNDHEQFVKFIFDTEEKSVCAQYYLPLQVESDPALLFFLLTNHIRVCFETYPKFMEIVTGKK